MKGPGGPSAVSASVSPTWKTAGGGAIGRHFRKQPRVMFSVYNHLCGMGAFCAASPAVPFQLPHSDNRPSLPGAVTGALVPLLSAKSRKGTRFAPPGLADCLPLTSHVFSLVFHLLMCSAPVLFNKLAGEVERIPNQGD